MPTLRNFCYHDLVIYSDSGEIIRTIPSEGSIRANRTVERFEIDGVPCAEIRFDGVVLPEIAKDEYFVVSRKVLEAIGGHPQLLCPDTSPESAVRDRRGTIIGVRRLRR